MVDGVSGVSEWNAVHLEPFNHFRLMCVLAALLGISSFHAQLLVILNVK